MAAWVECLPELAAPGALKGISTSCDYPKPKALGNVTPPTIASNAIVEETKRMPPHEIDPSEFLPLSPPMFQVLLSLADGDKHGYAILKDVEQRTEGKVILSTGTLYAIIKRLLSDGFIEDLD